MAAQIITNPDDSSGYHPPRPEFQRLRVTSNDWPSKSPVDISFSKEGALHIHVASLPELPESWLFAHFMGLSIQAQRTSNPYRPSTEIATQAYQDASAAVEAMKRIKEVTKALT